MVEDIEGGMEVDLDTQPFPVYGRLEHRNPPGGSHVELLRECKASIEDIVAKILAVKRDGIPKSQLPELVTQIFLQFITLRQVNRSVLLEEDSVSAETECAKASMEFASLQLHNLMYEKNCYMKAIKASNNFKSEYSDIELVSEEEFFCNAPEHVKGFVASNEGHSLMLKRLNFELFQRKELSKLHKQLEQHKKRLLQTVADQKKFSLSLPSHVKSLKKACSPVQNRLGTLHSKKLKQQLQSAELLPPPLYLVFSQLMAQKVAFEENIDLEIVGSVKDAQTVIHQQANMASGISSDHESTRIEDDVTDEEVDGQRRWKHPRKIPAKENLEREGYYQVHPLKVILHLYDDEASDPKSVKLASLKFEYMLKLKVVCVGTEGSKDEPEDDILPKLFPDDTGHELPHQSAKVAVGDNLKFDMNTSSRPYKWAQHLAGIHILPEVPPLLKDHEYANEEMNKSGSVAPGLSQQHRQENRVELILQRIRCRKKAQLALV
ncbi:hypothetical protein SAY87_011991 [Trapa incisa]|uniref:Uncharacterized protein n=1 Tax=Trapa incisa TaxID=236973 RepID=A0AAN7GX92_9MYRT|nr:hypothetical protein SAY87_011991 [Trapa incisa]